jgi:8-oxo-dGTP pyrophosphatase MutT (NUDIX family)
MRTAAGCIIVCAITKRILFQLRAPDNRGRSYWGFWGGKSEKDESPLQTIKRELTEEIGFLPDFDKIYPIHSMMNDPGTFNYITMLVIVNTEFMPDTNTESCGYAWVEYDQYPSPIHPGVKIILQNPRIFSKITSIMETISEIT